MAHVTASNIASETGRIERFGLDLVGLPRHVFADLNRSGFCRGSDYLIPTRAWSVRFVA